MDNPTVDLGLLVGSTVTVDFGGRAALNIVDESPRLRAV